MNTRRIISAVLATASLIALAACGSATDSITFTAPAGYETKASLGPFMQIWANTKDEHSVLVLIALPVKSNLQEAMGKAQIQDGSLSEAKPITICGNQAAFYAEGTGKVTTTGDSSGTKTAKPSKIEILATEVKGKTYLAMYGRPLSAPVDPAADKAVHNVCPK